MVTKKNNNITSVNIKLSKREHDLIKLIAVKENRSVNNIIIRAMQESLRFNGYYDIHDDIVLKEYLTAINE